MAKINVEASISKSELEIIERILERTSAGHLIGQLLSGGMSVKDISKEDEEKDVRIKGLIDRLDALEESMIKSLAQFEKRIDEITTTNTTSKSDIGELISDLLELPAIDYVVRFDDLNQVEVSNSNPHYVEQTKTVYRRSNVAWVPMLDSEIVVLHHTHYSDNDLSIDEMVHQMLRANIIDKVDIEDENFHEEYVEHTYVYDDKRAVMCKQAQDGIWKIMSDTEVIEYYNKAMPPSGVE